MTDLVAFLAARLDEDEAAALLAARADGSGGIAGHSQWVARYGTVVDADDPDWAIFTDTLDEFSDHIARHDPGRVLREVAAGRAILAAYEAGFERRRQHPGDVASAADLLAMLRTVKIMAAVYSDHPDYDPAWAPS